MEHFPALLAALLLAAAHLFGGALRFLRTIPRSRWLSLAAGISMAYVFVHLLPELAASQLALAQTPGPSGRERVLWLVALGGLAAFYGLERLARAGGARAEGGPAPGLFWLHLGSFAAYNLLAGHLLVERERPSAGLALFAVALAVHLVVNDHALREQHRARYDRLGRWLLAAAVLAGWSTGLAVRLPGAAVGAALAFLAGGVVLNTIKEELPAERESRFVPFAAGAAGYAALLLAAG